MDAGFESDSRAAKAKSRVPLRVAIIVAAVLGLAPSMANAQRIALRGEFGLGPMISSYQDQVLGYGLGLLGAGRFGVSIIDPLAVQLSFSGWLFPGGNMGAGQTDAITLGVRFEPRIGNVGRFFIDANLGPGWTPAPDRWRFYFDLGIGFEFMITPWFGLGPVLRYGQLVHSGDQGSDASFGSLGVSIVFRPGARDERADRARERARQRDRDRERERAERDRADRDREREAHERDNRDSDHDGVRDGDDRCPHTAAGPHPDPDRPGCPLPDSDDDGVPDATDRCPHTPAGHHPDPDRPGCPDGDEDDDGVPDHQDQCPHTPDGLHPDPNRPGCPLPDRDNDSVPDAEDACPTVPGAPSTDRRRNGCPGLVRIESGQIRILHPVFFAPRAERILPQSQPVLVAIVEVMRANPHMHISIEGHTDEAGPSDANLELSTRRADSVRDWLAHHGIDRDRLDIHGYGETRPIVPGHTEHAMSLNRRVEFHIVRHH